MTIDLSINDCSNDLNDHMETDDHNESKKKPFVLVVTFK